MRAPREWSAGCPSPFWLPHLPRAPPPKFPAAGDPAPAALAPPGTTAGIPGSRPSPSTRSGPRAAAQRGAERGHEAPCRRLPARRCGGAGNVGRLSTRRSLTWNLCGQISRVSGVSDARSTTVGAGSSAHSGLTFVPTTSQSSRAEKPPGGSGPAEPACAAARGWHSAQAGPRTCALATQRCSTRLRKAWVRAPLERRTRLDRRIGGREQHRDAGGGHPLGDDSPVGRHDHRGAVRVLQDHHNPVSFVALDARNHRPRVLAALRRRGQRGNSLSGPDGSLPCVQGQSRARHELPGGPCPR